MSLVGEILVKLPETIRHIHFSTKEARSSMSSIQWCHQRKDSLSPDPLLPTGCWNLATYGHERAVGAPDLKSSRMRIEQKGTKWEKGRWQAAKYCWHFRPYTLAFGFVKVSFPKPLCLVGYLKSHYLKSLSFSFFIYEGKSQIRHLSLSLDFSPYLSISTKPPPPSLSFSVATVVVYDMWHMYSCVYWLWGELPLLIFGAILACVEGYFWCFAGVGAYNGKDRTQASHIQSVWSLLNYSSPTNNSPFLCASF